MIKVRQVSAGVNDYAQVNAGMSKYSNYAHDEAMMNGVAVSEPDELLADIQLLENWRPAVQKRSEEIAKKSKSRPPVSTIRGA